MSQQRGTVGAHGGAPSSSSASLPLSVFALSLGIILLAAALRFHHLGTQSLWNDEGNAYVQATRNFTDIAANAARDIHPPGYYWLLALWRGLMGESEIALRSLSTFASILSIAFTFALGKRLFNPAAGLAAALVVALNSFSIYYAQEARMYALLALWGAAGMWALVGLIKSQPILGTVGTQHLASPPSPKHWRGLRAPLASGGVRWHWALALALVNAAGLYTQYAYPFIMLAQGVIFLLWLIIQFVRPQPISLLSTRYSALSTYIAANLLALLIFLPWLPTALRQVTQWPSTGTPIPPSEALGIISGWFTLGITYDFVPNALNYLPIALSLLLVGFIGGVWVRGRKGLWAALVPVLWAGLPIILFLALGLFRPANLKFLLPAQLGFALLVGAGFGGWWSLARRGFRLDRITLILGILQMLWLLVYLYNGLMPLYSDPHFQRPDYRQMVAQITADPREGDAIILDAPNQEEVFRYYYRGEAPVYPLPAGLGGDDAGTLAEVEAIIEQHDRLFVLFWGEAERDPNHIVERTLDSTTFEAGQDTWFGDVRFARYVTPAAFGESMVVHKRFGDLIWLERAAISGERFRAGDVVQVRLEWHTDALLDTRYKVFVQLLNTGGVLMAQRDSEPAGNSLPTTNWQPDEIVLDQHGLALPSDLPAGNYQIIVGLYNIDDANQRLTAAGKTYVRLGQIAVIEPAN